MVSGCAAEELLREWLFDSLMKGYFVKGYFVKFIIDGFHAKHNSSSQITIQPGGLTFQRSLSELRHLLCQHIALQGFVLALLSKGFFVGCYIFGR